MLYRSSSRPRSLAVCAALTALITPFAGCSGGGDDGSSSTPITPTTVSNATLRTTSLITAHGLYALAGGLDLYGDIPDSDLASSIVTSHAPKSATPLLPLPGVKSKSATAHVGAAPTFEPALNLYYTTARNNRNFQFSFFTDAAGTQAAGSAPVVLPASLSTYPNVTNVSFTLAKGNFPGSGAATITRTSASDYSIGGNVHLNNDNFNAQFTVADALNSQGNDVLSGSFLVTLANGQIIRIDHLSETQDAKGNIQLGATVTLNPSQANPYTGPLTTTDTGFVIKLMSGTKVLTATLTAVDANGDLLPHPTLHLVYPDGTTQDVADALVTPAQ